MAGSITEVTDSNFQAEVIESDTPVLVDFWAPWCGPCRVVAPVLEEINAERDDLRIVKLNIDDNQQTAAAYGIMAIPTMLVFRNGQEAARIQGAHAQEAPRGAARAGARRLARRRRRRPHRALHGGPARLAALVGVVLKPDVSARRARPRLPAGAPRS